MTREIKSCSRTRVSSGRHAVISRPPENSVLSNASPPFVCPKNGPCECLKTDTSYTIIPYTGAQRNTIRISRHGEGRKRGRRVAAGGRNKRKKFTLYLFILQL